MGIVDSLEEVKDWLRNNPATTTHLAFHLHMSKIRIAGDPGTVAFLDDVQLFITSFPANNSSESGAHDEIPCMAVHATHPKLNVPAVLVALNFRQMKHLQSIGGPTSAAWVEDSSIGGRRNQTARRLCENGFGDLIHRAGRADYRLEDLFPEAPHPPSTAQVPSPGISFTEQLKRILQSQGQDKVRVIHYDRDGRPEHSFVAHFSPEPTPNIASDARVATPIDASHADSPVQAMNQVNHTAGIRPSPTAPVAPSNQNRGADNASTNKEQCEAAVPDAKVKDDEKSSDVQPVQMSGRHRRRGKGEGERTNPSAQISPQTDSQTPIQPEPEPARGHQTRETKTDEAVSRRDKAKAKSKAKRQRRQARRREEEALEERREREAVEAGHSLTEEEQGKKHDQQRSLFEEQAGFVQEKQKSVKQKKGEQHLQLEKGLRPPAEQESDATTADLQTADKDLPREEGPTAAKHEQEEWEDKYEQHEELVAAEEEKPMASVEPPQEQPLLGDKDTQSAAESVEDDKLWLRISQQDEAPGVQAARRELERLERERTMAEAVLREELEKAQQGTETGYVHYHRGMGRSQSI